MKKEDVARDESDERDVVFNSGQEFGLNGAARETREERDANIFLSPFDELSFHVDDKFNERRPSAFRAD